MEIKRVGSQPSSKGSVEYFTGAVRIDPLFQATAPARAVGASVTFEPGARAAWHTQALGRPLTWPPGCGRARAWGPVPASPAGPGVPAPPGRTARARTAP